MWNEMKHIRKKKLKKDNGIQSGIKLRIADEGVNPMQERS